MGAQKYILGAILAFAVLAIPLAYAEDYVILTPSGASTYYNADFNQTAFYINTTLSPNATIVTFGTMPDDNARSSVASKSPKYIYLVVQSANLSPGFLNSVDNLTKWLDSDPYVDAGWSIITGYDSTSARDLFDRNMDASWNNNYVFVPNNANAQVAAGNQIASALGLSAIVGTAATSGSINTNLTENSNIRDFIYFSGNSSAYNELLAGDGQKCPAVSTPPALRCAGAGITIERILFFADASDAARVNGTNPDATWIASGQNPAANYSLSLPVLFSRNATSDKAAAYIGPHSTRWITSESIAKLFVSALGQGKDIVSALRFAKNILLFNGQNESLASNFTGFIEAEYNLFGKAQKPAPSPATSAYSVSFSSRTHQQNPVVYSQNSTNITWNATASVLIRGAAALYAPGSGWSASNATAWYRFVSPLSGGKINMSVAAALSGEIRPDSAALSVTSYGGEGLSGTITSFNISVNQTETDYLANESLSGIPLRRYDSDTDRIYFARLFSPNGTLGAETFSVNMTYVTEGISTNRTSISGTENVLHEAFAGGNPTDAVVTNATFFYVVPYNVTSNCSFGGGGCTLVDVGTARYARIPFMNFSQGTTAGAVDYNTTLDVNTTRDNNYMIYNRGENITVRSNVTAPNYTLLDYNIRLQNSTGSAIWSQATQGITVYSGLVNATVYNYTIPNLTAGLYSLRTYYLSNGTAFYASYEETILNITDQLVLPNSTFTSTTQDKLSQNYFRVNDSMIATGNVRDIHNNTINGANVNISLSGVNSTNTTTDSAGAYTAPFSWTGSSVGPKTLQVTASYNNNTAIQSDPIYITNPIADNISVALDKDATRSTYYKMRIYNLWENPRITVTARDPAGTGYVYKAPVALYLNGAATAANTSETDTFGAATMTFTPSATSSYTINVSAHSPLNTTKIVYNATETIFVMWLESGSGYFISSQSPSSAIVSSQVTFSGNLTLSYAGANESLITDKSLTYQIKTGGSDVTNVSSCTTPSWTGLKFSFSCTPTMARDYQLAMQASVKYDGVLIQTNDTYTFSVSTNSTSTGTTGSSGGGTSSSLAGKSCTNNANCSSGDYCSNNICTAITCTDGAIINHACVPNKKVNVTAQSQVIEIEQGNWGLANFTLSNNGFVGLSGVTFTLYLPQGISWADWYSFVSPAPSTLSAGSERTVSANISVPENASIEQYTLKAKVTTKEGAVDEKAFTLQVSPSARNRDLVKIGITELNLTIGALEKDVLDVMARAPEDERKIAERKLDAIRALYIEAQAAVSKGNYFEAYSKQKEISDVISDLRVILADKKARDSQAASRRNMIAGVVIILAAIAGGFYYLWVPAPSGYSPGRGYSYNSGGKEKMDLDGIVEAVKKKISDILSKFKRQEATVSRKYDYLKPPAKRW